MLQELAPGSTTHRASGGSYGVPGIEPRLMTYAVALILFFFWEEDLAVFREPAPGIRLGHLHTKLECPGSELSGPPILEGCVCSAESVSR